MKYSKIVKRGGRKFRYNYERGLIEWIDNGLKNEKGEMLMFNVKIMTSGNYPLDPTPCEIRRLLDRISRSLENGNTKGFVFDFNGNKVGEWKLED